jgi:hypothetical protein
MWTPIDTQFYAPRLPVGVVALPNGEAVVAIRQLLELLQCVVVVHWVGTPSDFLKILGHSTDIPRYLILEGHGGEEGFYLGTYIPTIDTSMLDGEYLSSTVIRQNIHLPGCTVINLACNGGMETMAKAFLAGNVAGYIGCRTEPDVVANHVFLTNLFYSICVKGLSDRDAWYRAVEMTAHEEIYAYSYFDSNGVEERYL